jgi:hypothetical protein
MKKDIWTLTLLSSVYIFASITHANGYVSKYEVPVDIPVPTGIVTCSGESGVNPKSKDEYIIRDGEGWNQINNIAYNKFFVCPGDYTYRGVIKLTKSGSSGKYRYIVYWRDTNYSAYEHPYRMKESDRAKVKGIHFEGADFIIADRLAVIPTDTMAIFFPGDANADDNIVNRVWTDGSNAKSYFVYLNAIYWTNDRNTIQNSVISSCPLWFREDSVGLEIGSWTNGTRIINNEFFDCGHQLQLGGTPTSNAGGGTLIENNDFYNTLSMRLKREACEPAYWVSRGWSKQKSANDAQRITKGDPEYFDPNGPCGCNEGLLSFKYGAKRGAPAYFIHNRVFQSRGQNNTGCGGTWGLTSTGISLSPNNEYMFFEGNIISDVSTGFFTTYSSGINNLTIRSNTFYHIKTFYPKGEAAGAVVLNNPFGSKMEYTYNTIVDGPYEESKNVSGWLRPVNNDIVVACNLVINGGSLFRGSAGKNTKAEKNVYIGQSQNMNEPGAVTYSLPEAKLTDYCYNRKLITGPEKACIESIVPTNKSPFLRHCSDYYTIHGYGAH